MQTLIFGELCQLVNIILNFFKAYHEEGNEDFEMNFFKISDRYIKEELKTDLLIFIPFGLIGHISPYFSNWKILWSIKVTRINELTDILDQKNINPIIRKVKENNTQNALLDDQKKDDNLMDHINILRYLLLQYAMRLFKLTILVFVFSYFVGIYWYIFMSFF